MSSLLAAPHPLVHHSPRGHGTHTLTRHAFIQLHFTDIPPPPSSCSECTMNPVSKCGNQLSYPLASHVMPQHPCVHARGPPTYPAPTVTIVTSVVLPGPRVCSHPPLARARSVAFMHIVLSYSGNPSLSHTLPSLQCTLVAGSTHERTRNLRRGYQPVTGTGIWLCALEPVPSPIGGYWWL